MGLERDIKEVFHRLPRSMDHIERMGLEQILLVFGGGLAIIFAFPVLIIEVLASSVKHNPGLAIAMAIFHLFICLIFGFGLLYAYAFLRERPKTSFIIALVSSIILFFGHYAGMVGGILGFIGALLFFLKWNRLI